MKKKIIVITVFSISILTTLILFASWVMQALSYDMYSNNEFDIGEGVFGFVLIIIGGIVVFYELDLFYTVYYFLIKTKTKIQSILNIIANLTLVVAIVRILTLSIFSDGLLLFDEVIVSPIYLFLIYFVLRIIYFIVSMNFRLNKNK